jgi:hypothetical protein
MFHQYRLSIRHFAAFEKGKLENYLAEVEEARKKDERGQ